MPVYLYRCEICGKEFEIKHSIKEEPRKHEPHGDCNGKLKRLIAGGTLFQLKGGGWTPKTFV